MGGRNAILLNELRFNEVYIRNMKKCLPKMENLNIIISKHQIMDFYSILKWNKTKCTDSIFIR